MTLLDRLLRNFSATQHAQRSPRERRAARESRLGMVESPWPCADPVRDKRGVTSRPGKGYNPRHACPAGVLAPWGGGFMRGVALAGLIIIGCGASSAFMTLAANSQSTTPISPQQQAPGAQDAPATDCDKFAANPD